MGFPRIGSAGSIRTMVSAAVIVAALYCCLNPSMIARDLEGEAHPPRMIDISVTPSPEDELPHLPAAFSYADQ